MINNCCQIRSESVRSDIVWFQVSSSQLNFSACCCRWWIVWELLGKSKWCCREWGRPCKKKRSRNMWRGGQLKEAIFERPVTRGNMWEAVPIRGNMWRGRCGMEASASWQRCEMCKKWNNRRYKCSYLLALHHVHVNSVPNVYCIHCSVYMHLAL